MSPADPHFDDLVSRTRGLQPWRRFFHALNGVVLALAPGLLDLSRVTTVSILVAAFVIALGLDVVRLRRSGLNVLFFKAFRLLASPREASGIASSTWYALGAALAWGLFPPLYAAASLLVLALADPAASLVGRSWGSVPLGKGSVQGSIAFLLTAWAVLVAVTGQPLAVVWVALGVSLVEILPGLVDDNLVVPLSTGALLWLVLGTPTSPLSFPF
jgi:dolichol kinase